MVEAFWKLIRGAEIRKSEWLDYVRDTIRGGIEMHDPDAGEYTEEGSASLVHYGRCLSDAEYSSTMLGYRDNEVQQWLDRLRPEDAHTIIFESSGS